MAAVAPPPTMTSAFVVLVQPEATVTATLHPSVCGHFTFMIAITTICVTSNCLRFWWLCSSGDLFCGRCWCGCCCCGRHIRFDFIGFVIIIGIFNFIMATRVIVIFLAIFTAILIEIVFFLIVIFCTALVVI